MPNPSEEKLAPSIGVREAYKLFSAGDATFVDVRSRDAYDESHVTGSLSMPLRELFDHYTELSRDRKLVVY